MNSPIQSLQLLGLKPFQLQAWLATGSSRPPWRVRTIDRGMCRLVSVGEGRGSQPEKTGAQEPGWPSPFITGHARPHPETPLAVGDWVLLDETCSSVSVLLERAGCVRRGVVGEQAGEQLIVSNVDTVFIVAAFASTAKLLARGVNPRRIERYVAAVRQGNALPVVVLNKADLSDDVAAAASALSARLGALDVVALSAEGRTGLSALAPYLGAGQTVALLGMSGVGKSTLVNALLGQGTLKTARVRDVDAKGKHTTTRRELVRLPSGALLIDTPGMREVAVVGGEESALGFADVEQLAAGCKFTDCQHGTEPHCAVREAIELGTLLPERLTSYLALSRDALRLQARNDAYARHVQNKQFRHFTRVVKQAKARKP